MSSLLCIAGPPGAGKSTLSALVSSLRSPSVLIRGDEFFRFLDQGKVAPWRPEATDQNRVVIQASGAAAGRYVRGGFQVIFDGVLGPWWLPTFLAATELDELDYAILLPSADRCVDNVAARDGHVDERATRDMHHEFQHALANFDPRHVMNDRPGTPEDMATELLTRHQEGQFLHRAAAHSTDPPSVT